MLLDEYLQNNNLFGEIENIKPYVFINSNSNINLSLNYGDRVVSNNVLKLDLPTVAGLIVERFNSKWVAISDEALTPYKLGSELTTVNEVETTTQTDHTDTVENINKVSGFNDAELLTDTGSTTEDVKTGLINQNVVNTSYQLNLKALFNNLNYYDKINIISIIHRDIANYLTLQVY